MSSEAIAAKCKPVLDAALASMPPSLYVSCDVVADSFDDNDQAKVAISAVGLSADDPSVKALIAAIQKGFSALKTRLPIEVCSWCTKLSPPPAESEWQRLSKQRGWRKRRFRREFPGLLPGGSHPSIGEFTMTETPDGRIRVKAKLWGSKRFASWYMDGLCNAPEQARDRLLFGWAISCMAKHDGFRVRDSVGHPGEALRMAAPILKLADEWEAWALG